MWHGLSSLITGVFVTTILLLGAGALPAGAQSDPLLSKSWDEIVKEARGQTVHWWMWAGDEG